MKFSGKICLEITLKVTKEQGFTLSLEDAFFEKLQGRGEGGGVKLNPLPPAIVLGLKAFIKPFKVPQKSVKIKIYVNFYFNVTF